MPIEGLDHVALTVTDVEAAVAWYERVLCAEPIYLDLWRSGAIPVAILQLGGCRLSLHPASAPAPPHADAPTVGSGDICFRFSGSVGEILALLAAAGVDVEEGPVGRPASDGTPGTSIYFRDLDQNLLELLTIDAANTT